MISEISIRHFRTFENLKLTGLQRLNLVAGANNSGKTSLLEAVFLNIGANNPELCTRLSNWRGMNSFPADGEGVWGWLFHQKVISEPIEIATKLGNGTDHKLRISLLPRPESEYALNDLHEDTKPYGRVPARSASDNDWLENSSTPQDLLLDYANSAGSSATARATITNDGKLRFDSANLVRWKHGYFVWVHIRHHREQAEKFSRLKAKGRQDLAVKALQAIDRRIQALDILVIGGEPVIHGDIGAKHLIPLPMMGDGFNRALTIVLAIADLQDGVVMIDEVDAGIHHSALESLWASIGSIAAMTDSQVFATTHSRDCVAAAQSAVADVPECNLALIQLYRTSKGLDGRVLQQSEVESALETNIELR